MPQISKKDLITKLIASAKSAGNANPWALGFVAFDDLRMKIEGALKMSGEEWYASHKNDPMGMNDVLTVPEDLSTDEVVRGVFSSLTENGGANLWVIPTDQLADVFKYLISHPRFQGNLLDRGDENPWDEPQINFDTLCAEAESQFLANKPVNVVFQYKDADTGLVVHQITLNEKDFWYFVDEQQMKIADRHW